MVIVYFIIIFKIKVKSFFSDRLFPGVPEIDLIDVQSQKQIILIQNEVNI